MKILAIIPARKGSVELKRKNLKRINKVPLINYAIKTAIKSKIFNKIIVSSDCKTILNYNKKFKNIEFLKRPSFLAKSTSSINDVVKHIIKTSKIKKTEFDYLCILEPTSPLRDEKLLIKAKKFIDKYNPNNFIFVKKTDSLVLKKKRNLFFFNNIANNHRQNREPTYLHTGIIYAVRLDFFNKTQKIINKKVSALEIENYYQGLDINNLYDFNAASSLMKK